MEMCKYEIIYIICFDIEEFVKSELVVCFDKILVDNGVIVVDLVDWDMCWFVY